MQVTIESVLKNKQLYNGYVQKVLQDRKQLMQQVTELRKNKQNMTDEKDIARNEFEYAKLVQEIGTLTNGYKNYKLTLEQLDLQQDVIEGRIDKETYAKGMDENKRAKVDLSLQEELEYCENEVDKCKKALKLYTLDNDIENSGKWEQALNKAIRQLREAQENVMQQEEQEEKKEDKEQSTEPYTNESGEIIRPGNAENIEHNYNNERLIVTQEKGEGYTKETRKLDGIEMSSTKEFEDGSFEGKSQVYVGGKDVDGINIKSSNKYINYTTYKRQYDAKKHIFIDTEENPLIDNDGNVIGEQHFVEREQQLDGFRETSLYQTIEGEKGYYQIESNCKGKGEEYSEVTTMEVDNKISGNKEKAQYTYENGKETYLYMENGVVGTKIVKTEKGTTIDIYKDGQPYETYEYDENGQPLIQMAGLEQLPDDYVKSQFNISLPEFYPVPHRLPEELYPDNEQSILDSAEEAINENTRRGKVNEQAQAMKAKQKERMNTNIEKEGNDLGLDDE